MTAFFLENSYISASSLCVLILKPLVTVADMNKVLLASLGAGRAISGEARLCCPEQNPGHPVYLSL